MISQREGLKKAIAVIEKYTKPLGARYWYSDGLYCSTAVLANSEDPDYSMRVDDVLIQCYGLNVATIQGIVRVNDESLPEHRKQNVIEYLKKQLEACGE